MNAPLENPWDKLMKQIGLSSNDEDFGLGLPCVTLRAGGQKLHRGRRVEAAAALKTGGHLSRLTLTKPPVSLSHLTTLGADECHGSEPSKVDDPYSPLHRTALAVDNG